MATSSAIPCSRDSHRAQLHAKAHEQIIQSFRRGAALIQVNEISRLGYTLVPCKNLAAEHPAS
jgi:hypothetical protein